MLNSMACDDMSLLSNAALHTMGMLQHLTRQKLDVSELSRSAYALNLASVTLQYASLYAFLVFCDWQPFLLRIFVYHSSFALCRKMVSYLLHFCHKRHTHGLIY